MPTNLKLAIQKLQICQNPKLKILISAFAIPSYNNNSSTRKLPITNHITSNKIMEQNSKTSIISKLSQTLDGSLPANTVNNRRVANAVTLKSTFRLP